MDKNDIRNSLRKMRNLVENSLNNKTAFDQFIEEKKLYDFFDDNTLMIDFQDLEVHEYGVIWGGIINNEVGFVYTVSKDSDMSTVEINYDEDDFNALKDENQQLIKKIENYYTVFYKYWRDNFLID